MCERVLIAFDTDDDPQNPRQTHRVGRQAGSVPSVVTRELAGQVGGGVSAVGA